MILLGCLDQAVYPSLSPQSKDVLPIFGVVVIVVDRLNVVPSGVLFVLPIFGFVPLHSYLDFQDI